MTTNRLLYPFTDSFIDYWLVAGPLATDIPDLTIFPRENLRQSILAQNPPSGLEATLPPVDLGPLGEISIKNPSLRWQYTRCQADHLVDLSSFALHPTVLRAWAYAGITIPETQEVVVVLATYGPADLWLNGEHLFRQAGCCGPALQKASIPASLQAGENQLLVRFEAVGLRETPLALAVRLQRITPGAQVFIPTEIEEGLLETRIVLEETAQAAFLDRYVYGYLGGDRYAQNEPILLQFSKGLEVKDNRPVELTFRLQSLKEDIFQEGSKQIVPGSSIELAKAFPLRNGPHHLAILPEAFLYYKKNLRFERKDLIYIVRSRFVDAPYGKFEERRREALEDASRRRGESLYTEIAKIALQRWESIDRKVVGRALEGIRLRREGSVCDLLGILGILLRTRKKQALLDELRPVMIAAIAGYRYWQDVPTSDGMDFETDNRAILFHTCEILAGQVLPDQAFLLSGQSGAQHRRQGERRAAEWMRLRGRYGFCEWDSPLGVENALAALSFLVDLAQSEEIRELASILMDKIFFLLAANSFQGMYGSTRGRTDTASVLSPRLETTSGISKLMWGMGNFNESLVGTVSLACCRKYKLPATIRKIAADTPAALWSRERHAFPFRAIPSPMEGKGEDSTGLVAWEANKVTYKTEHFLLSSAQDYYPGKPGQGEHIWQATLGPDAVVFSSHPACMREDDARLPNLWAGNGVLPRVAQWGDVLVAIYRLPGEDWLGFTHAYFPAHAFDEYLFHGHWALARKGQAYLALWAARGLEWISEGKTALRELRSHGLENIWLCQMGQELLDGSFADFRQKILALDLAVEGLGLRFTSLRGEEIAFAWEGPLRVNGQEQALSGFKHVENPYCVADLPAEEMEIVFGGEGVRLSFQ